MIFPPSPRTNQTMMDRAIGSMSKIQTAGAKTWLPSGAVIAPNASAIFKPAAIAMVMGRALPPLALPTTPLRGRPGGPTLRVGGAQPEAERL